MKSMNRRIAIGTLFLVFGLIMVSVESGQAQIGPITYTIPLVILKGFAVLAFAVSALYLISVLVGIFKEELVSRLENYVVSHIPRFLTFPIITLYVSALFIVFTQGLVMGVTKLPWDNFRLLFLLFGLIWIVFISLSHIRRAYRLGKSHWQNPIGNSGKSNWLREIVRSEMKLREPPTPLIEKLRQITIPNWKPVLFMVVFLAISILLSWVLSTLCSGLFILKTEDRLQEFYLNMWQVQGAIAAVALPLLIVVIEFSKDLRHLAARLPEALVRETWVFPIIVFALVGTVRLGIDITWFQKESVFWFDFLVIFMGTICFTIVAYTRMLLTVFSPVRMQRISMALIRSKMHLQLNTTIEQRIANNILLKKLRDLGLDLWPFPPSRDEEKDFIILRSPVTGVLYDIDLGKLEGFINRLPWRGAGPQPVLGSEIELEKGKTQSIREQLPKQFVWWMKQYGKPIMDQNNGLVRLDRSKFDVTNPADLEARLGRLVKLSKEEEKSELHLELSHFRDSLMDSIKDCKTGGVQEGLQIYYELIIAFLDKLQQWGSTYKKEQAIRESTSLEGGWFEVRWITHDLQEIIDMALRVEYINVIKEVIYFPIRLASLAFSRRDYYIFYQFLDWVTYYYNMALRLKDITVKDFIVSRCSMYLAETLRYHVIPSIERGESDIEIEDGKDFATGIILIFNRLLKSAYDERQMEHFKAFSATVNSVFEFYFRHNQEHEVISLEHQLRNSSLTDVRKEELEKQLKLKQKHVWASNKLEETIRIMFYGLNSWLLHQYIDDKITASEFNEWDQIFQIPKNLQESWEAFSAAAKEEDKDDYGWSFWESREQENRIAFAGVTTFWGGFERHLRILFCVHCLRIIGKMNEKQKGSAVIPHARETIFLAENESSPLRQLLQQIEQDAEKWEVVIGDEGLKAIPAFKGILEKAVQAQRKEENEFIKAANLSAQRVQLFKQEIVDNWSENAELREIVLKHGDYQFVGDAPEGKNFLGFNQLQPKDIYVDGTDIAVEGWGSQFGRDLATSENEDFIKQLINNVKDLNNINTEQNPVQKIAGALDSLEKAKYKPIIIILNSWVSFAVLEKSELFHGVENQPGHGLVGYFRDGPVFNLHYQGEPYIILVDLNKFCTWRQYKPRQIFAEEEYLTKELTFLLKMFTEESAKDAIQQNPKLLLDKNGNQRTENEVISELQLQVHFRLLEQYEIEIKDRDSGYRIQAQW